MKQLVKSFVVMAFAMLESLQPARAVLPNEMLQNPALETRARDISRHLRCVVCQNQSIDDSNAPLAHDLRVLVRERLSAGDSDRQAMDFIVARYGNFVLLKPPFQWNTLLLWFGPAVLLALATFTALRFFGTSSRAVAEPFTPLTDDEQRRLADLVEAPKP